MSETLPTLHGIPDIRAYFRTNETPVYFVSPTAFNLLGIDRWLRNFFYITYFDSFEGSHPRVFVPHERPYREFESMEDICNYLLGHKEVLDRIERGGAGGKAVFVMFDDATEAAAAAAGLEVAHPSAELRHRLDSKIVTTQLGNEAGVPSAPNTLGRAGSFAALAALAESAGLGDDLVVQTPYGDSGKTTFFIRGERDWDRHAKDIVGQEIKVMRRLNVRAAAVEAALTRHGTIVGPLMNDLIGHPELTPHKGGWCGNDIFPDALSPEHLERARMLTQKLGDRLAAEGYRGFLEVDYLVDADTGELYLGELNPRISGVTSMTNVTAGAYADIPLFLFHLLEYLDAWTTRSTRTTSTAAGPGRRASTCGASSCSRTPATRWSSSRPRRARASGGWTRAAAGSPSRAGATTGTACTTSPRRSSCACWRPATTAIPAPTSACSSRARACRRRTTG